jgi:hypothetical protein
MAEGEGEAVTDPDLIEPAMLVAQHVDNTGDTSDFAFRRHRYVVI